jgi:DNA topoisomerase III
MTKSLIIAEKPSVARDIVAALGGFTQVSQLPQGVSLWESNDYICGHALGHILELYEPEDYNSKFKQWRIQDLPIVPDSFLLKPKSQTAQILRILRQQIARSDITEIINACDAAREGELIFREVMQHALCNKATSRVWMRSMTHDAIRSAFAGRRPGRDFQGLANAAHGRSQADWLIGMNLSRAATLKLSRASEGGVWSIGRVQTPTLAMLVEREFSILSHDPQPFQLIKAKFSARDHDYDATWIDLSFKSDPRNPQAKRERITTPDKAATIHKRLIPGTPATATEVRKSREQKAPPLFSLTALQRHMSNRYKWTAKHTLEIAQKCYEQHKIMTYPRTESDALPEDYKPKVTSIFEKLQSSRQYGALAKALLTNPWHNEKTVFDDKAVSDHFAIIPTGHFPQSLPRDEGLLFDVVIQRLLASLMAPAVIDQVERTTVVAGETFFSGPEEFTRVLGWQAASISASDDSAGTRRKLEHSLKPLTPGASIALVSVDLTTEQTKPPHRIGEAQLLSLMEHAGRQVDDHEMARVLKDSGGLGTAATRAEIIENLKHKDYIFENLQPTVKGLHLIRFLKLARAEHLTSPKLTGELETHLRLVESTASTRDSFIRETAKSVDASFNAITHFDLERTFDHAPALGPCPRCDGSVHERMWNYSCLSNRTSAKPCGFTLPKDCDGRWLDPPTVTRLLSGGDKGIVVDGFPTTGKSQSSQRKMLKMTRGQLDVLSEQGTPLAVPIHTNDTKSSANRRVTWGLCPVHHSDGCLIVETKNAFICESKLRHLREGNGEAEGFQLPKSICDQRLKFDDINAFIRQGKTRVIEGFKSKGGKIFDAAVVRNPTGRWTFEFRSR